MKTRNTWIAVLFLTVIFVLPVMTLADNFLAGRKDLSIDISDSDQNPTADDTASRNTFSTVFLSIKDRLGEFTGQLFAKKLLISFNMNATTFLTGGYYFESTQVLLGKDNWLFYKSDTEEEHPIRDYMGTNHFTEEELAQIARNLEDTQNFFENEWGASFYAVSVPNKELVYSEYMPETVLRVNIVSRGEQLAEYMKEETDIPYLYLKDALVDAKSDAAPLYYKTDSHWNYFGSYVGLQAIFQELYGNGIPADISCFTVESENYTGDLAILAGMEERFAMDTYYMPVDGFADPAQYHDQTLLLVGDSFSEALSVIAVPYYREVHYIHYKDFQADMMEQYRPDVVIWECVERYMDAYKNRRLMEQ